MYDVIGDIHGYATPLKALLNKLGYIHHDGYWQHPKRKVIFLGDFIDRGPEQLEVINTAKPMVENGAALAVMGNHEFNAVAFATPHPTIDGTYLRKHSDKNLSQHQAFIDEVGFHTPLHHEILDWFKTLPVYLDLPELRVIHACWHEGALNDVSEHLNEDNQIHPDAWLDVTTKGLSPFDAMETLLKGYEIPLPPDHSFPDKDNHPRTDIRSRWWQTGETTYRNTAMVPPDVLHHIPDDYVDSASLPGYDNEKLLFLGHYWLTGLPEKTTDSIAILDYSIASESGVKNADSKLCAYRFNGESQINNANFIWVDG